MSVDKKLQELSPETGAQIRKPETQDYQDLVLVKSNYARGSVVVVAGLPVSFNSEGEARIPKHHVAEMQKYMRARPGRFTLVMPKADSLPVETKVVSVQGESAPTEEKKPTVKAPKVADFVGKKEELKVKVKTKKSSLKEDSKEE